VSNFKCEVCVCTEHCRACRSGLVSCVSSDHLHPFYLFLTFLDRTGWNYSLLLDFIMSPETCFLLYLIRTLKSITGSWKQWTDACRNYVQLPKQKKNGCQAEQGASANFSDVCARDRMQNHENIVSMSPLETLVTGNKLLDAEDVVAGEKVVHLLPCFSIPRAVDAKIEISSDTVIQQDAIVDYSSSSDEEELNSSHVPQTSTENIGSQVLSVYTTGSVAVTKKRRIDLIDFVTSNDGQKEETALLLNSSGERLMGKCGSEATDTCRTLLQAVVVLSQLRCVVSRLVARNMFPFNVQPLIRHLHRCEVLYADNKDMI